MTTWAGVHHAARRLREARRAADTDWERGFVDSLRRQIEQGRRPTPKQIETLDATWEARDEARMKK